MDYFSCVGGKMALKLGSTERNTSKSFSDRRRTTRIAPGSIVKHIFETFQCIHTHTGETASASLISTHGSECGHISH